MKSIRLGGLYKAEGKKYIASGKLKLSAETLEFLAKIPAEGVYLQIYKNENRASDKHPHWNATLFVPDDIESQVRTSGQRGTYGTTDNSGGFDTPAEPAKPVTNDDLPF